MAKPKYLSLLSKDGVDAWNTWRKEAPTKKPNLRGTDLHDATFRRANLRLADLSRANLNKANLRLADLSEANLNKANLERADLRGAILFRADLTQAILRGANLRYANLLEGRLLAAHLRRATFAEATLRGADLRGAILFEANLRKAYLTGANLLGADLTGVDLRGADLEGAILSGTNLIKRNLSKVNLAGADLSRANLREANLSGADLSGTNLRGANLGEANLKGANLENAIAIKTNFNAADLTGCRVYGISAWDVALEGAIQSNLIITEREPHIQVDDLEIAQFIYLLLNRSKLRNVMTTLGEKGVLILGRFTERKELLNAIADKLRSLRYLPIIFDFERPTDRDVTETVKILTGLSRFVIADITNPRSVPLELQATVPDYMVPFVTIAQRGQPVFSMFDDLPRKYHWALPLLEYKTAETLLVAFEEKVVAPALEKLAEVRRQKALLPIRRSAEG